MQNTAVRVCFLGAGFTASILSLPLTFLDRVTGLQRTDSIARNNSRVLSFIGGKR